MRGSMEELKFHLAHKEKINIRHCDKIANLNEEKAKLQRQNEEKSKEIMGLYKKIERLEQQNKKKEEEIIELKKRNHKLGNEVITHKAEINILLELMRQSVKKKCK